MKKLGLLAFAFALLGAGEPLSTQRYVHGVITSLDPDNITINSAQQPIHGKFDPKTTKITIEDGNGVRRPATLAELKVSAHASGELCLAETWVSINQDSH